MSNTFENRFYVTEASRTQTMNLKLGILLELLSDKVFPDSNCDQYLVIKHYDKVKGMMCSYKDYIYTQGFIII